MARAKLRVRRKAFHVPAITFKRNGKTIHRRAFDVKATTIMIKDRGKVGRTPKRERFFAPTVETGWRKDDPPVIRRRKTLKAHKGDLLATARSLVVLANVTLDKETERKARQDAKHFFARHRKSKRR